MAGILAYHRVADVESDVYGLCVSPVIFQEQMSYVKSESHVVPLRELVDMVAHHDVPPDALALTFDDGYLDNYTEASPILRALSLPATFFITSDRLDSAYEYWWDALERIFLTSGDAVPAAFSIRLSRDRQLEAPTASADERRAAHALIYRAILDAPAEDRDEIIERLIEWSGISRELTTRRIDRRELRTLSRRPQHEIAAHSVRHLMLPQQPMTIQEAEIHRCRLDLEDAIGQPVTGFAYPFSAFNEVTASLVREFFDYGVTNGGTSVTASSNRWLLPRIEVRADQSIQQLLRDADVRGT